VRLTGWPCRQSVCLDARVLDLEHSSQSKRHSRGQHSAKYGMLIRTWVLETLSFWMAVLRPVCSNAAFVHRNSRGQHRASRGSAIISAKPNLCCCH
jgi:hypothetical protein